MSFKKPKLDASPTKTIASLLENRAGEIPELARGNRPLQSTAHVEDTGHENATPLEQSINISDLLSVRSSIYTDYTTSESSMLLYRLVNRQKLEYQNETEVQSFVSDALRDAIAALGLSEVLVVRPEISLFSYRPDIIVVTHSSFGIILIVEVKKPGADVFTSHSVAGQVYDYLVGMLGMGISRPFAVLSTYEQMVIANLDDEGKSRQLLMEVAGNMEQDMTKEIAFLRVGRNEDEGQGTEKPPRSPLSKLNPAVSNDHEMDDGATVEGDNFASENKNDDDSDNSDWQRALYYSKVVEQKDVLKSLMLAIRCGIASCINSPSRFLPAQGSTMPSFACARVNEDGMVWCHLPSDLKVDYYSFPSPLTRSFYLLRELGRGSKGRAFLVCNSRGKALVAKFFLIKDDEAHRARSSAKARQERRAQLLSERKSEAEEEMGYWNTVYNGDYDVQVRKLHGHWCLMLPYFDPIFDVQSRKRHLPEVRRILERFRSEGFKYDDDDVRWRHVGIRGNKICLFDLGSLEPCDKRVIDVEAQIKILEDKIESGE